MARTKSTARSSTGGKAPRRAIATKRTIARSVERDKIECEYTQMNQGITDVSHLVPTLVRVKSINLSCNLISTLPDSFSLLAELEILILRNNKISDFPTCLSGMEQIKTLDLSENQISGGVDVHRLTGLVDLDLQMNRFPEHLQVFYDSLEIDADGIDIAFCDAQALPRELLFLPPKPHLDISNIGISVIPDWLSQLSHLDSISMSNNEISCIPDEFYLLRNITYLDMGRNSIEALPEEMSLLKNLKELDVGGSFSTSVKRGHKSITTLPCWNSDPVDQKSTFSLMRPQLYQLDLYDKVLANKKLSDISPLIESWDGYQSIDISCNEIKELPDTMSRLTNLKRLCLSKNQLSEFPTVLFKMNWLEYLNIADMQIESLPEEFTSLTCLEKLDFISSEKYCIRRAPIGVSQLPFWSDLNPLKRLNAKRSITNKPKLELYDRIYANKKLESISGLVENLISCQSVDLSFNMLSTLPESLSLLSNMAKLCVRRNHLSEIPPVLSKMTVLQSLDMSQNKISSLIDLTLLTELTRLTLAENNFESSLQIILDRISFEPYEINFNNFIYNELPECLLQLPAKKVLYTSDNELSCLPNWIGQMTWLQSFHVGDNRISSLPLEMSSLLDLSVCVLMGNELNSFPEELFSLSRLKVLDVSQNKIESIPNRISLLSNITDLYLQGNPIECLPAGILCLKNLKNFYIEASGEIYIQRAPCGITQLPCWIEDDESEGENAKEEKNDLTSLDRALEYESNDNITMERSEALRTLDLYELVLIDENLIDISGLLPGWMNFTSIDISFNKISFLPESMKSLTNLRKLCLSCNELTEMPDVLYHMTWIESLDLSHNKIDNMDDYTTTTPSECEPLKISLLPAKRKL